MRPVVFVTFALALAACGPSPKPAAADESASEAAAQSAKAAKYAASAKETCPARSEQFDRGCAAATLLGVDIQDCRDTTGPRGDARIQVTFLPTGDVSAASWVEPGPFAGTSTGECILGKFRAVHMTPFDNGTPTHVKVPIHVR
jgi:hypothetical protein